MKFACCKSTSGEVSEIITCIKCKHNYHSRCLFPAAKNKDHSPGFKKTWLCPQCTISQPKPLKNDDTPVRMSISTGTKVNTSENVNCGRRGGSAMMQEDREHVLVDSHKDGVSLTSKQSIHTSSAESITYDRFDALLDSKLSKLKISITEEITARLKREINNTIELLKNDFNKTTEYLADEQKDLKAGLREANDRVRILEQEKQALGSELLDLERRMDTLDKASRNRNVEIHCVPQKRNENLFTLIKKLYESLKLTYISEFDICSVRRVAKMNPNSDRPRTILLTLPSERHRDILMSTFKRHNKNNPNNMISSNHLSIPGETKLIYLSEHLSSKCKELHSAARKASKEFGYKFVWVKYGKIYMRKDEQSNAIIIKSASCLDKLRS